MTIISELGRKYIKIFYIKKGMLTISANIPSQN